jgi:hypothetical protein
MKWGDKVWGYRSRVTTTRSSNPGEVSQVWTQVGGSRSRLSDGVQHSV